MTRDGRRHGLARARVSRNVFRNLGAVAIRRNNSEIWVVSTCGVISRQSCVRNWKLLRKGLKFGLQVRGRTTSVRTAVLRAHSKRPCCSQCFSARQPPPHPTATPTPSQRDYTISIIQIVRLLKNFIEVFAKFGCPQCATRERNLGARGAKLWP